MPVIYKVIKAKAPFTSGIATIQPAAPKDAIQEVKPVQVEEIQEQVSEEQPVEETVEEVAEEVAVEEQPEAPQEETVAENVTLVDAGVFSERSIKLLETNNITTVEELKAYLESHNNDLTPLAAIGKRNATIIIEELAKWETSQQQ